jgi:hypothetical protein
VAGWVGLGCVWGRLTGWLGLVCLGWAWLLLAGLGLAWSGWALGVWAGLGLWCLGCAGFVLGLWLAGLLAALELGLRLAGRYLCLCWGLVCCALAVLGLGFGLAGLGLGLRLSGLGVGG